MKAPRPAVHAVLAADLGGHSIARTSTGEDSLSSAAGSATTRLAVKRTMRAEKRIFEFDVRSERDDIAWFQLK